MPYAPHPDVVTVVFRSGGMSSATALPSYGGRARRPCRPYCAVPPVLYGRARAIHRVLQNEGLIRVFRG